MISTHTLTWSVTTHQNSFRSYWKFQLTRSRGAWHTSDEQWQAEFDFNSHAHVERDASVCIPQMTARSISTHTLTWSVTSEYQYHKATSEFQLTRSRGAWRGQKNSRKQSNRFQLTRSRGAWHRRVNRTIKLIYISTHTLTWSVTLKFGMKFFLRYHFNSHAHVERDGYADAVLDVIKISTHTLTWSVTRRTTER